jgi:hypothetical protein
MNEQCDLDNSPGFRFKMLSLYAPPLNNKIPTLILILLGTKTAKKHEIA